jgi:hypothetical protein
VTLHLKAIFAERELAEEATCKDYLQVRREGKREITRKLRHYRLEAILAVGYRVRSHRGTQFRQWATARLGECGCRANTRAVQLGAVVMGVRKFHSVEEMPGPPPRKPLDPDNLRVAFGLPSMANGLCPIRLRPGVRKFRSWDEAQAAKDADERSNWRGRIGRSSVARLCRSLNRCQRRCNPKA